MRALRALSSAKAAWRRRGAVAAAGAVVLIGGLVAGCGVGGTSAFGGETASTTVSTATVTQPAVTTVADPTVAAQDLPGYSRPAIYLGSQNAPMPEQLIIAQLYQLALQAKGYTVHFTPNIGEPSVRLPALEQGTLDLYPENLSYWDSSIAGLRERFRSAAAAYRAGQRYARTQGFVLLNRTPFSDTWGLVVTSQYAQMNHIRSIADLARGPIVSLGATSTFDLKAVERAYGLEPFVRGMTAGAEYERLDSGNLQVAQASTTDPQLLGTRYRLLADPKHVSGFGNIVPITTPAVLDSEGPAFAATINRVDSLLTLSAIRGLNAEYAGGDHSATAIAAQFLQGNGILPASEYAPVPTSTSATASGAGGG